MNAAAGQTVNLVEGGHSLPLSINDMVAPVGKKLEQGGKAMATRIRRAVVAVALELLMAAALGGAAWAATFVGTAKLDQLIATRNDDTFYGLDGWNYMEGKPAADELYGGNGSDTLKGMYGNDYLVGGRGHDEIEGWQGNDHIEAADGRRDFVGCGPGDDYVSVDSHDSLQGCEVVNGER